ncbi:DUF1152 domain-containing protein [Streptomyces sp. NPDC051018]|uniref:DUF1152 domain-containing protein n=1 Tax=Streptomyces sp. NPDC051018 TaxID=3365639 RepID=UPI0037BB81AF
MTRLIVAAGGGGDVIAASMLDAALHGPGEPAVILTFAWDRLAADPVPGPRSPADFTGLRPLTANVYAFTAKAEPIPPAGSTFPRLAAELPQTLALVNPRHGAQGIRHQLEELIRYLAPESVDILDVGGDILARGDEPGLRTPLADALTLAACSRIDTPVRLLVAGPGLDGEVPAGELRGLLGRNVLTLAPEHVEPVAAVLEWHSSEVTAMLAATVRGIRGLCEAREGGLPIPLTDEGPTVHEVALDLALGRNRLARALVPTRTLAEAEQLSREICGFSEIDDERDKATWFGTQPRQKIDPETALGQVARFEREARGRNSSHTTFRRLTEALGLHGTQREELRALLVHHSPGQYVAPLWHLSPRA